VKVESFFDAAKARTFSSGFACYGGAGIGSCGLSVLWLCAWQTPVSQRAFQHPRTRFFLFPCSRDLETYGCAGYRSTARGKRRKPVCDAKIGSKEEKQQHR